MIIRSQRLTSLSALQKLLELVPLEKEERGASADAAAVSWASPAAVASGSGIAVVDDHADGGRQRRGLERVRLAPQPRHLLHERAHAGRRRRHGRQRRHRHLRVEDRLHFFGGEDVAVPDLDSIPTDDK